MDAFSADEYRKKQEDRLRADNFLPEKYFDYVINRIMLAVIEEVQNNTLRYDSIYDSIARNISGGSGRKEIR